MLSRDRIVSEARAYVGVPFKHQGRSLMGVDCLGMVVGVAESVGLHIPSWIKDARDYARQPNAHVLKQGLDEVLVPVPRIDAAPGAVLLMAYGRTPQHVGICTKRRDDKIWAVHVTEKMRRGVEHRIDPRELSIVKTYDFPGVETWRS